MDTRAQKLWQRGMTHFRQGNMDAAKANFEAFLARDPGSGPGRFRLSMVLSRQGRYLAAIALAEQALAADPDRIEILTHLARCHLVCGQLELARSMATKALALPRENPLALELLGEVLTRLDEQAIAMELFDQAIALEPGQAAMYFNRGLAQKQFGLCEEAERDLETCLAMNPGHAKSHWILASLKSQDQASNHVQRLRQQLERCTRSTIHDELVSLALYKELDDLGDLEAAWPALERGIVSRRERWIASEYDERGGVDQLIKLCDEAFVPQQAPPKAEAAPAFIFGMPRSGVAVLGKLLSRHSKVHYLGYQRAFFPTLSGQLGRDSPRALNAAEIEQCRTLDFEELGRRYLSAVAPAANGQVLICESQPMNFQLAGFIARALPAARMLHLVRDPVDNCVSILGQAGGEPALPCHDPGKLAAYYLEYHRLMQHWHQVLPGRIMDVSYESLVAKPEMVLRVVCAFIGIRYGSPLRMGLDLHQRSVGRGRRYLPKLRSLAAGLAPLERQSRSA